MKCKDRYHTGIGKEMERGMAKIHGRKLLNKENTWDRDSNNLRKGR